MTQTVEYVSKKVEYTENERVNAGNDNFLHFPQCG